MGRKAAWAISCLAAGALALALSACGGDSPEATANAKTTAISAPKEAAPATDRVRRRPPAASGCIAQLDPFLKAMATLRTSLVAGLAYEQYVAEVQKVIAAYRRVPVDELPLGCVRAVGAPGERALNRYIAAANTWTDCVEVPTCEAASVEAPLQGKWRKASEYLSKAQRGLTEPAAG